MAFFATVSGACVVYMKSYARFDGIGLKRVFSDPIEL